MFGLGTTELIVIGVIIFLIFGAKRIPDIGKGLGGALREFRNVKRELKGTESEKDNKEDSSLEGKMAEKVLDQVPAVKKARDVKNKVQKVKEIIE
jgi:sec-independent protein translocase protein TatA